MSKFIKKYGNPFPTSVNGIPVLDKVWQKNFERVWMQLLKYPSDVKTAFPTLGESVYINIDFAALYLKFLRKLIERDLSHEVTVNDQCFNIRLVRGSLTEISTHSWGMAVDLNPFNNPLGVNREQSIKKGLKPFTAEFQEVAKSCGIVCGYDFKRCDGMHFEHSNWN